MSDLFDTDNLSPETGEENSNRSSAPANYTEDNITTLDWREHIRRQIGRAHVRTPVTPENRV